MESCNVVQFKQSVFRLIRRSSVDALRVVGSVKVRLMALWSLDLIVTPHALSLLILSGVQSLYALFDARDNSSRLVSLPKSCSRQQDHQFGTYVKEITTTL